MSAGTDRTGTDRRDVIQISHSFVEFVVCHFGVSRFSVGIPGDCEEVVYHGLLL